MINVPTEPGAVLFATITRRTQTLRWIWFGSDEKSEPVSSEPDPRCSLMDSEARYRKAERPGARFGRAEGDSFWQRNDGWSDQRVVTVYKLFLIIMMEKVLLVLISSFSQLLFFTSWLNCLGRFSVCSWKDFWFYVFNSSKGENLIKVLLANKSRTSPTYFHSSEKVFGKNLSSWSKYFTNTIFYKLANQHRAKYKVMNQNENNWFCNITTKQHNQAKETLFLINLFQFSNWWNFKKNCSCLSVWWIFG